MDSKLKEKLDIIGNKVVSNMRDVLEKEKIDATGKLSKSITYRINPNYLEVSLLLYGTFVDEGTKPHIAPIDELQRWITAKGLTISPFAVFKSIKEKGTEPHPWIYKIKETLLSFDDEFLDFIDYKIKTEFDERFRKIWSV